MANYDPQVEARAAAELQRLTAELKAATEQFQANAIGVQQYEAALQRLQPQLAAQQQLAAEQERAARSYASAAQVAERAAKVQADAAVQAAAIQARAAEDAANIQAKAAERAAQMQARGAERAAEVQKKAATQAADHQAREAKRAAAVQEKDAEQAAAIQAAAATKAAEIQAQAARGAADIQAIHAKQAADHQAKEALRAEGIQGRAATKAAQVQADAAVRAQTIQEAAAARAAEMQAREATRAAQVQAAQAEAAAAKIVAAEKQKAAAVETTTAAVQAGSGKQALVMFQIGQVIEDLQYGFHSILNNLSFIAMNLGWSNKLVLGITIVGVAINQLAKQWDNLISKFRAGTPIEGLKDSAGQLQAILDDAKKRMGELEKMKVLNPADARAYADARKDAQLAEEQITKENEKQARLKALENMQSLEERQREQAFSQVIGEEGGERFRLMEKVVTDQNNKLKADLFRENSAEIARLERAIQSGDLTRNVPLGQRAKTMQDARDRIATLRNQNDAERQASEKSAKDLLVAASQGKEFQLEQLEKQFPAERDPRTGGFRTDTPELRAGAAFADVRNVEATGKTQKQLEAAGEANAAAWRKAQREKEIAQKRQVEQEQEADELDKMALAREQAKERAQRALDMGQRPAAEDELLVRQPGVEVGQHRRDQEWKRMEAQGAEAARRAQEQAQQGRAGPLPRRGPFGPVAGMNPDEQMMAAGMMGPMDHIQPQFQAGQRELAQLYQQSLQQMAAAQRAGNIQMWRQMAAIAQMTARQFQQNNAQMGFVFQQWNMNQFRHFSARPTAF